MSSLLGLHKVRVCKASLIEGRGSLPFRVVPVTPGQGLAEALTWLWDKTLSWPRSWTPIWEASMIPNLRLNLVLIGLSHTEASGTCTFTCTCTRISTCTCLSTYTGPKRPILGTRLWLPVTQDDTCYFFASSRTYRSPCQTRKRFSVARLLPQADTHILIYPLLQALDDQEEELLGGLQLDE